MSDKEYNISMARKIVDVVLFTLVVVVLVWVIIQMQSSGTLPVVTLAGGWLSNPLRTTRKLKFPSHHRVSKVEKGYIALVQFFIGIALIVLILGPFIIGLVNRYP